MAETKLSTTQLGSDTEVYNQENLLPGYNVSITEIPQPIVDPNTVALWHFDGNLTDEISGLTMNGKQTSDYHKFGTGSGYEVGQYDSGFTSWKTEIPGINFEQDSFTVDGWVYYNGSGAQKIMFGAGYKSGYYFCGTGIALFGTYNCVRAYFNKSGSDDYGSADYPITSQGWHHLAVQQDFDNQKVQFFVDGHMFYEASGLCQSIYSNTTVNIANAESVWYDEIRVSNVVRWTEDFTPFSQPYANSSVSPKYKINNTLDISGKQDTISDLDTIRSGAAAGATAVQPSALTDYATVSSVQSGLATKQDTLTAGGGISITQIQKPVIDENTLAVYHFDTDRNNAVTGTTFGACNELGTISDLNAKFGNGLFYPDGVLIQNDAAGLAISDFTVDFWLTFNGLSPHIDPWKIFVANPATDSTRYGFEISSSNNQNNVFPRVWNATVTSASTSVSMAEPHHFAIERRQGVYYFYVDGVLLYNTDYYMHDYSRFIIHCWFYSSGITVDELRISNVARYQGQNFTPFNQPYAFSGEPAQYQINNTLDISGKQDVLTAVTGFDATKTQVLKHVNGVLQWVDETPAVSEPEQGSGD